MFVVIFEVEPRPDRTEEYLGLAGHLKPMLEAIDGFLDVERFSSSGTQRRLLSLSAWRDEKALVRWRTHAEHHRVQAKGRAEVFQDYRLRVGEVTADTRPPAGIAVEQTRFDETEIGPAKAMTITETMAAAKSDAASADPSSLALSPATAGLLEQEVFSSIYTPGKLVLLASWHDAAAAQTWKPPRSARAMRHRQVRIIRDYGMFERREAPQYYPQSAGAAG